MYSNKVDRSAGVQYDQIGKLSGFYTSKEYPEKLRRIKFYDEETKRTSAFLTNNMELTSNEVALLYKKRWQVECFSNGSSSILRSSPSGEHPKTPSESKSIR